MNLENQAIVAGEQQHNGDDRFKSTSLGEITQAALESARSRFADRIKGTSGLDVLAAAIGRERPQQGPSEKDRRRGALLGKAGMLEPERLFATIAQGVVERQLQAYEACWLSQQIINAAAYLAASEWVVLKQQAGIIQGVSLDNPQIGAWTESTNTDDLGEKSSPPRHTENPFSREESPEAVRNAFLAWYKEHEVIFIALSGASATSNGAYRIAPHSHWEPTAGGFVQICMEWDDYASDMLRSRNSAPPVEAASPNFSW